VEHFLAAGQEVSGVVMEKFLQYDWPGNVRELKNVVTYAAAMCSGGRIDAADLPVHFLESSRAPDGGNIREDMERALILKVLQSTKYNRSRAAEILNVSRKTLYTKMARYGLNL
jgi:transcriptional regulator of acetoin/glycerol metabolism